MITTASPDNSPDRSRTLDDVPHDGTIRLDAVAMRKLLPHRHVMALLDSVEQYQPHVRRIRACKLVSSTEFALQGYLPRLPMFPPTLIVEALAQTCGIMMNMEKMQVEGIDLFRLQDRDYLLALPEVPLSVLAESHVRQHSIVEPGQTIRLDAHVALQRGEFRYFKVAASVDSRAIASGTILLSYPTYM